MSVYVFKVFLILECEKINLKSKLCQLQRVNKSKGKKMELMDDDKKMSTV